MSCARDCRRPLPSAVTLSVTKTRRYLMHRTVLLLSLAAILAACEETTVPRLPSTQLLPPLNPGSKIAFHTNQDGNFEIYSMAADGSGLRRLTENDANDGFAAWSPNGRRSAFHTD